MFIDSIIYNSPDMEQPNCPSTCMDREDVVHIYNGILLNHKKEQNWVICRDMDGPGACDTEWSKSGREKQILYTNAFMWNLEKWSCCA